VRAVMGIALMLALESHHNRRSDRERAITLVTEGSMNGFFPPSLIPKRRGR